MTSHFEFYHPAFLLFLIPWLICVVFTYTPSLSLRRRPTFTFSATQVLAQQKPTLKQRLAPIPTALKFLAALLLILGLARPQSVTPEKGRVEGIDIVLTLDVSGSMRAIDISPEELDDYVRKNAVPDNRFRIAVKTLQEFIDSRPYDRIGMVVFAKDAFLQFPLTLDRNTIRSMLDSLEIGDIDPAGTAIGNAIGRSLSGLKSSKAKSKIIILITDGDRQGGNISPAQATEIAKKYGIHIYPILVGKDGDAVAPAGRDLFSGRVRYQRVNFPTNPDLLQSIADQTEGTYYRTTDAKKLKQDLHDILNRYEKTSIEDSLTVNRSEKGDFFLLCAALIFALQALLEYVFFRKFN